MSFAEVSRRAWWKETFSPEAPVKKSNPDALLATLEDNRRKLNIRLMLIDSLREALFDPCEKIEDIRLFSDLVHLSKGYYDSADELKSRLTERIEQEKWFRRNRNRLPYNTFDDVTLDPREALCDTYSERINDV